MGQQTTKPDNLNWESSPITIDHFDPYYISRGFLRAKDQEGRSAIIPFGASSIQKDLSIKKSLSELSERLVWYEVFHKFKKLFPKDVYFSTTGWAAHEDLFRAKQFSIAELIERYLFNDLISFLEKKPSQFKHFWEKGLEISNFIDLSGNFPLKTISWTLNLNFLKIKVVFLAGVYNFNYSTKNFTSDTVNDSNIGVVFGMGKGLSNKSSFEAAKFELFLIYEFLQKEFFNKKITLPSNIRSTTQEDRYLFSNLFRNELILESVLRSEWTNSLCRKEKMELHETDFPDFYSLNLSSIIPLSLNLPGRKIIFTGWIDDNISKILLTHLSDFIL